MVSFPQNIPPWWDRAVDDAGRAIRADVRSAALRFAERIALSAPLALLSIRETLRAGLATAVEVATAHELAEQTRLQATADFQEGIAAAAQRRAPLFTGR